MTQIMTLWFHTTYPASILVGDNEVNSFCNFLENLKLKVIAA